MSYGDSPDMLDYIDHLEAENERLREANKHLKERIEKLQAIFDYYMKWKPVSEKLEKNQWCLCRHNYQKPFAGFYHADMDEWTDDNGKYRVPTHYLPLQLYQEDV
jgi:hypothetical protein